MRSRDVPLIVTAIGLSALGDFLLFIPLAIHLADTTGSGLVTAALPLTLWAPVVLLAGPAGLLTDRVDRRRLLIAASLVQAAVAAAIAFVDGAAAILVLTTLLGIGFAVAQPAEFALVPLIAPKGRINEVNGYVETARYLGMAAGPALGGALATAGGMRLALLANAFTFLLVALAGLVLRERPEPRAASSQTPGRARDGVVFLMREPTLAVVMVAAFVSLLFMSAQIPAEAFFFKDELGVGDAGFGIGYSSWFAGMTLGALVFSRRFAAAAMATGALAATALQGLGLAVPAIWPVFPLVLVSFSIGGVGHGVKNVLVRTLIHDRVPDELRGRAFAAYNAIRNGAELIALVAGGLLLSMLAPRWILLLAGGISALVALSALIVVRKRAAAAPPAPAVSPS
jgi:MFS family permease